MRQELRRHGRDNRIFGSDPIPPGQWIYVGGSADPGWTEHSPAFQNGWGNAGGGLQRLRFRLTNEDQLEIQGAVTGGTASVVATLPDLDAHFRESVFWPIETATEVGTSGATTLAIWQLSPAGELSVVSTTAAPSGGDIVAAGGIIYDFENVGDYLHILANGDGAAQAINLETDGVTGADGIRIYSAQDLSMYAAGSSARLEGQTQLDLAVNDSTGPMFLTTNNGDITVDAGTGVLGLSGDDCDLQTIDDVTIVAGDRAIVSGENDISILSPQGTVQIQGDDAITVSLAAGKTFTLRDSSNNPMLQMTEGSPDLHLKAGAAIVYDL